jgi:hypothetical protein
MWKFMGPFHFSLDLERFSHEIVWKSLDMFAHVWKNFYGVRNISHKNSIIRIKIPFQWHTFWKNKGVLNVIVNIQL